MEHHQVHDLYARLNPDRRYHINSFDFDTPNYFRMISPGEGEFIYANADDFFRDAAAGKIPGRDKKGNPIKPKRKKKKKMYTFSYRKVVDYHQRTLRSSTRARYFTRSVARLSKAK